MTPEDKKSSEDIREECKTIEGIIKFPEIEIDEIKSGFYHRTIKP
jgi:glutaredoxin